jgi:hypothetical protein
MRSISAGSLTIWCFFIIHSSSDSTLILAGSGQGSSSYTVCGKAENAKGRRDMESEVLRIFEEIRQAMLANDADVLKRHVAEDYVGSDAGGRSHDRDLYLAAYGPGGVTLEVFDVSDIQTKEWTDTVVITGLALLRGDYQGQRFEHRSRFLDVYRFRNGAWQVVASSVTDLVEG